MYGGEVTENSHYSRFLIIVGRKRAPLREIKRKDEETFITLKGPSKRRFCCAK